MKKAALYRAWPSACLKGAALCSRLKPSDPGGAFVNRFAAACFAVLLGACASPALTPEAEAQTRAPTLAVGEWTRVEPEPIMSGFQRISATCSDAPGSNPAYAFWARRGTGNGLVIFFDGGGACWDDLTCSVPWLATGRPDDGFYKAEILPGDDPSRFGGMFLVNDERNPVRDWSFIYVPYCTGDVHLGSNTTAYRDVDSGEQFEIRHRGADNFRVVLAWARANMGQPQNLLVTGSSAGAYGAVGHYVRIRDAFPRARAIMLGDAGQGVTTPEFAELRDDRWGARAARVLRGNDGSAPADDMAVARLAALYPNDIFAQFTTANDRTQAGFYALMGVDDACTAWREKMTRDLTARQAAPNFRSYVAAGDTHTILRSQRFFTETSGGETFVDWFAALIRGERPENRACVDCQPPPQRCGF